MKNYKIRPLFAIPLFQSTVDVSKEEKDYILKYHLMVYSKLSNFLNTKEKRWFIKNL